MLIGVMVFGVTSHAAADVPVTKRILLLHQAGVGGPIRAKFDAAFVDAIRSTDAVPIDLYEETIETERFHGAEPSRLLRQYLQDKYADRKIDVIVSQGIVPLTFARQNRELFGNPPIVAVASPAGQVAGSDDDVTGLQGGFFINGTIDLALELLPDTETVFVVDGARENQGEIQAEIEQQVSERKRSVGLVYLRDLPLSDLLARIAAIPERAVVLFVRQTMRNQSQDLDQFEALAHVLRASPVPVFSQLEEFMGRGIVGGYVWRFETDAWRMAEMARQIASGASARDIPPGRATYNTLLDWQQLQRWNIPESRIPAGSIVLFRPQSFFEFYRNYALSGLLVITLQLALIVGLFVQRIRRRRAEARTSAVLRAIPDLMFVLLRDGTYVDYHAKDPALLFVPPSTFMGKNVRDVMPPRLADVFMEALVQACQNDETVVVEYELPIGRTRYYEARLVHAGGDRILSMVRDVTESKQTRDLNHDLAGRLIVSQEEERQRIARELHDDLSQKIALLNIEIDQVAKQVAADELRSRLQQISHDAGEIASDVHNLSHELHPSKLQTLGLVAAIHSLCQDVTKQRGVQVAFTHGVLPRVVDPMVSLCLYRITQEALHNIAQHSQAREARVRLTRDEDDLALQIADSGIGFDQRESHGGLGLISMRERVAFLRGQLTIDTMPGAGTHIEVRVPLLPPAREEPFVVSKSA
jgi:signal transduction histidine kinase